MAVESKTLFQPDRSSPRTSSLNCRPNRELEAPAPALGRDSSTPDGPIPSRDRLAPGSSRHFSICSPHATGLGMATTFTMSREKHVEMGRQLLTPFRSIQKKTRNSRRPSKKRVRGDPLDSPFRGSAVCLGVEHGSRDAIKSPCDRIIGSTWSD